MGSNELTIPLTIQGEEIKLTLYGESASAEVKYVNDAVDNGEGPYQIKEGHYYEYAISNDYCLQCADVVFPSKHNSSRGRIAPNIYVGTLTIDVYRKGNNEKCGEVRLEVCSTKTDYRKEYRFMLEEITDRCTDLLLQHSSPVSQLLTTNFEGDAETLYQRFAFIKSILDSDEFLEAVHKVVTSPVTSWKEQETIKDIRSVKRFKNSSIRQLAASTNRINLPAQHPLRESLGSIPVRIRSTQKIATVDTPENRFIKFALIAFQLFCNEIKLKAGERERLRIEAEILERKLEQVLSHSFFKEVSGLSTLPLNSPVLQRKEGYREVLRVWLMFDLAAKMAWKGGEDVYGANKRDVAVLYEYWLFFKLVDIVSEVFKIEALSTAQLIEETKDGLGLKLKQGQYLTVKGVFVSATRKFNVEFGYNRTFSGNAGYPTGGSWTRNLRPDYTLSIWPNMPEFSHEESQRIADREELIVHIHFDAKYRVENLNQIFGSDDESLDEEKISQKSGTFKRADLLKMHTYKDAIRRTAGAYVLYPGTDKGRYWSGFHELIPGLGAFAIRPTETNNGIEELKQFLHDVVEHFLNRASQREKMSFKTYDTHRDKPDGSKLNEAMPEAYGENRGLIPDETFVLTGYSTNEARTKWYKEHGNYVFRMDDEVGSLEFTDEVVKAKYLLLRTSGNDLAEEFFKIRSKGPKVWSKAQLEKLEYPFSPSPKEYYLVVEIEKAEEEYLNRKWRYKELKKYKDIIASGNVRSKVGLPFTVSLKELMLTVE